MPPEVDDCISTKLVSFVELSVQVKFMEDVPADFATRLEGAAGGEGIVPDCVNLAVVPPAIYILLSVPNSNQTGYPLDVVAAQADVPSLLTLHTPIDDIVLPATYAAFDASSLIGASAQ